MSEDLERRVLAELQEVRSGLREVEGTLATDKAIRVMRRTHTSPVDLVARYAEDRSSVASTELLGYRLSSQPGPASETCVHVAFDPELDRVVIYEEWD